MEIPYSMFDLLMYLLLYSFLGWAAEVLFYAVRDKCFVNRGFLNVPFSLPYGIAAVILMVVLPTLNGRLALQYTLCCVVYWAVMNLSDYFAARIRRDSRTGRTEPEKRQKLANLISVALIGFIYLMVYLLIHPLIFGLTLLMPDILVAILVAVFAMVIVLDFFCVLYSLRTKKAVHSAQLNQDATEKLASRMQRSIRSRLEKNYPGILADQEDKRQYIFAEGMCADKLVWVFLVSSFLGALIEMVFCRVTGGAWMSRSSLLYGAFSVVWGFGAVILTVTLRRLMGKADRYIFLAGFVIGGAYEYLCSVFTEIVFGTVFWDYSHMPLNIGGRTNVLYCIFWGLLAVVWIKVLYPPMSAGIEKIPALLGKILTWIVVFVMLCNGVLTCAAMIRYSARQEDPASENLVEQFLDTRYDDDWMEHRWPNMKLQ